MAGFGCGEEVDSDPNMVLEQELVCDLAVSELPYASEVVSFEAGVNAGYGQSDFPNVVLGAPAAGPKEGGSLEVLSLGIGGGIVLGFGSRKVGDKEGPDFVIFENPFAIGGDPTNPFAELARVSVSQDGENWTSFECKSEESYPWYGCAGWQIVGSFDPCVRHLVSEETGADLFDLADLGIEEIRFIRISDLAQSGSPPSAGFDLDAVGAFHLADDF